MTYRRLVLQRARPAHYHYHYTEQNHNVSCILCKPQRLRNIKPNHQGTPKQLVITEIRFFALKSKKEKVPDRDLNGFLIREDNNNSNNNI